METNKNHVLIFDSTLRDGEQSPGASLNVSEKLEVAHQLARLNIDIMEAGFPVSSPVQFEAVSRISKEVDGPVICALARTVTKDIDSAAEALAPAKRWRIHTFTSTSPTHIEHMLRMTPAQVLEKAVAAVRHAKSCTDDVEFSGQDAPRSDVNFLYEIIEAVIEAGATTINIPDTVGYSTPEEYGKLIADIRANVASIDKVVVSTHCHNDLGMAVANSLAGVVNGARQIECTLNGLGERAGNASLEEVVMAMKTRKDLYGVETQINCKELYRSSQMISRLTGLSVQVNKAIVGANAFAHESGIHVDGILKHRETYEIMTPESVGVPGSRMVLGRHSGRHGFQARCEELGFDLDESQLTTAYTRFMKVADKKKEVFDEDIMAILKDEIPDVEEVLHLEYLHTSSGTATLPSATVRILRRDEVLQEAAWGDGPVDAAYNAISKATGLKPKLENYTIKGVTPGTEALGEAVVRIKEDGRIFAGHGASTDIIEASAKAYVNALNHMLARGNGNANTRAESD